jgi:hypothetical protein
MTITAKQAARIRWEIKAGKKKVSDARRAQLADYEARQSSAAGEPASSEPASSSSEPPSSEPASSASSEPPPPPSVEPPPPVKEAPRPSSPSGGKSSGDWRDKYRQEVKASDDGREMLCEMIGGGIAEGLAAMCDEMKRAGISPGIGPIEIDPRLIRGMFILAADDLLPSAARMSPKVGAAVATTIIVGKRYYYAKEIAEALKHDPAHQEWLRKQKDREAAEQRQRAEHAAEAAAASSPSSSSSSEPPVQYPEPPPPPEPPAVNGTAIIVSPARRSVAELREDTDAIY